MPNAKTRNGLYPTTHSSLQALAKVLANALARWLGSRVRDGRGVVVVRYGAALRDVASTTMRTTRQGLREVLATLLAPLTRGVILGRT